MWFAVNDVILRFGLTEFFEITDLMCGKDNFINAEEMTLVEMRSVVGHDRCTNALLEEIFLQEPKDSEFKYNLTLIIFIEG